MSSSLHLVSATYIHALGCRLRYQWLLVSIGGGFGLVILDITSFAAHVDAVLLQHAASVRWTGVVQELDDAAANDDAICMRRNGLKVLSRRQTEPDCKWKIRVLAYLLNYVRKVRRYRPGH